MKPIEERIEDFKISLNEFQGAYSDQMIQEFFEYWTEQNKSNTKFRMELESTWSTSRRLARWAKNSIQWNKPKTNGQTYKNDRFANLENIAKGILEGGH